MGIAYTYSGYRLGNADPVTLAGHCKKVIGYTSLIKNKANLAEKDVNGTFYNLVCQITDYLPTLNKAIKAYDSSKVGQSVKNLIKTSKPYYMQMYSAVTSNMKSTLDEMSEPAKRIGVYVSENASKFYSGSADYQLGNITALSLALSTLSTKDFEKLGIKIYLDCFNKCLETYNTEFEAYKKDAYLSETIDNRATASKKMKALFVALRKQIDGIQGVATKCEDTYVKALNEVWKEAKQAYAIAKAAHDKAAAAAKTTSESSDEEK